MLFQSAKSIHTYILTYNAKISDIGAKYFTASYYNILTVDKFGTKLK